MLKVQDSPVWADDPVIKYAIQYSDEQFSELSKVWADLGFELLVHKQDVDPLIDMVHLRSYGQGRLVHCYEQRVRRNIHCSGGLNISCTT